MAKKRRVQYKRPPEPVDKALTGNAEDFTKAQRREMAKEERQDPNSDEK